MIVTFIWSELGKWMELADPGTESDQCHAMCGVAVGYLYKTHSAPEQWPREKKTSSPKINPNESVLLLYIDIW